MAITPEELATTARRAVRSADWPRVAACAREILRRDAESAEGHFLIGLVEKAARRPSRAADAFARALSLDAGRHDAAVELAHFYSLSGRQPECYELLQQYEPRLQGSPRYLDLAGLTYSALGLHDRAWALHRRANELQPGVARLMANLAECCVYAGRIDEARSLYQALLQREPSHQRYHYHLARLEQAKDASHIEQMRAVLDSTGLPPERNIFLYYAIGKEFEDLGRWDEAFTYYRMAGDAASSVANYEVGADIALIDTIIEVCTAEWLAVPDDPAAGEPGRRPIFIVGLPRTGTTLAERILASHSQVATIGETMQLPTALARACGVPPKATPDAGLIRAGASASHAAFRREYLRAIRHRLGSEPLFIEKFPENFLYLGFIARAWPDAGLVYLQRHPMDTCFAMYKQSYFRYAYSLENVGRYFVAHRRLLEHWRAVLGKRLVEVRYESLVADQERETRALLAKLGLRFEPACLEFERHAGPSATASAVQVREKMHARSVNRWRHFESHLQPLRRMLEDAGIEIQ